MGPPRGFLRLRHPPKFIFRTLLVAHPLGVLCLDNAFSLIGGHLKGS